jgi:hypothetical protein
MEKANNPTRMGILVREQVEARLARAKKEWEQEWRGERRRLNAEIERLKKTSGMSEERRKEARLAVLEKLGKLPPGSALRTPDQLRREYEQSRRQWDSERDQLLLQIKHLENEVAGEKESMRSEILQELQAQFEPKFAEVIHDRRRLTFEVQIVSAELHDERERLSARIAELERAVMEAEGAARAQSTAEIRSQFEPKLDEAKRLRTRAERKLQDTTEELEDERRRAKRQIVQLEEQVKEAKEAAFKATRNLPKLNSKRSERL